MVDKENCTKCCVHFWRLAFIILNSLFFAESGSSKVLEGQQAVDEDIPQPTHVDHNAVCVARKLNSIPSRVSLPELKQKFLIGLALVALSIYLLSTGNDLSFFTGNQIASGGALILIAGVVTAVISFLGVLGAIGMWPVLLIIYLVLLFIIVVLEIVAGILGFVYRDQVISGTESQAVTAIRDYRLEEDEEFQADVNSVLDFVQTRFRCCGYTSRMDWDASQFFNDSDGLYPGSCNCTVSESQTCVVVQGTGQVIYNASCNTSLNSFLEDNLIIVGGVGIAFGLFEIIGIALGVALTICFCVIQRKDKDEFNFSKAV